LLHLLQPLARWLGRARTRRLPGLATTVAPGDRLGWVDALHVRLARQARVRRGSTTDAHDLRVAVGPLVETRLTTGLRWGARPVLRTSWRPRRAALAVFAGLLLLVVVSPLAAAGSVVAVAALAATEVRFLRRCVGAAAAATAPRVPEGHR
jgi:hypothetical protein